MTAEPPIQRRIDLDPERLAEVCRIIHEREIVTLEYVVATAIREYLRQAGPTPDTSLLAKMREAVWRCCEDCEEPVEVVSLYDIEEILAQRSTPDRSLERADVEALLIAYDHAKRHGWSLASIQWNIDIVKELLHGQHEAEQRADVVGRVVAERTMDLATGEITHERIEYRDRTCEIRDPVADYERAFIAERSGVTSAMTGCSAAGYERFVELPDAVFSFGGGGVGKARPESPPAPVTGDAHYSGSIGRESHVAPANPVSPTTDGQPVQWAKLDDDAFESAFNAWRYDTDESPCGRDAALRNAIQFYLVLTREPERELSLADRGEAMDAMALAIAQRLDPQNELGKGNARAFRFFEAGAKALDALLERFEIRRKP